jgi:uncharacterized repeat protein (TIGR03943 family)
MRSTWNYLSLLAFGIYILYLFFASRLVYFIHPRYEWLTTGAGFLLIVFGIIGLFKELHKKKLQLSLYSFDFIVFILIIALTFVPIRSLSSESFAIRSGNTSAQLSQAESQKIKKKFEGSVDSSSFTMYDWVNAKGLNDSSIFTGKNFKGSGFISPTSNANYFSISRFIVSCCVVDATPAGLLVKMDWQNGYKADEWVQVSGVFETLEFEGKIQPVIIPTTITTIQQPKNIYLNRE